MRRSRHRRLRQRSVHQPNAGEWGNVDPTRLPPACVAAELTTGVRRQDVRSRSCSAVDLSSRQFTTPAAFRKTNKNFSERQANVFTSHDNVSVISKNITSIVQRFW